MSFFFSLKNNINQSEINDFAKSLHYLTSFSTYNYYDRAIQNHTRIFNILQNNYYTVDILMREVRTNLYRIYLINLLNI